MLRAIALKNIRLKRVLFVRPDAQRAKITVPGSYISDAQCFERALDSVVDVAQDFATPHPLSSSVAVARPVARRAAFLPASAVLQ